MSLARRFIATLTGLGSSPGSKPRDDELDLFGLTHTGKVRKENQDHFLICTVHRQVVIHSTSLSDADHLALRGQRLATIMLVADGVGSSSHGQDASRLAVETVTRYVSSTMRTFVLGGETAEQEFTAALRAGALEAHAAVGAASAARPDEKRIATTLTMAVFVWPNMYVTQVGDSRCYYYQDGRLRQVTRDQTMAQALVDRGAMPPERVADSPLSNVLASSIGGEEAAPEVTRLDVSRDARVLLCSDGLTKHLSNAEIGQQIGRAGSSEQLCRALVDLALDRGGTDNVTVVAGRTRSASSG